MNLSVAYNDFGITLQQEGYLNDAESIYRKALELDEDNAAAWCNLGTVLSGKALHTEALEAFGKTLKLEPDMPQLHSNISLIYAARGQNELAVKSLRKAIELAPDFVVAHSNLICELDLAPGQTTETLQAERKAWAKQHAGKIQRMPKAKHKNKKLRIGYVSADFRHHSAVYSFGAMLMDYDREQFDVYAYYNYPLFDQTTDRLEASVTKWRDVHAFTDFDLARQIRHDQIDILVDLSGHSAGNRLLTFARKPANIQMTAWGYLGGTGLQEMDYMLADPVVVPESERHLYAEKIIDMPCAMNMNYRIKFPDITERSGDFTFGSFNRLPKFTPELFKAWGEIMTALPDTKLLLKTGELDDEGTRDRIIAELKAVGIDQRRVRMMGKTKWEDHVAAFNLVDVCLDTFPQGGGVTTMETLMMGVPVVTLAYPTLSGRVSASIMRSLGMDMWVTNDVAEYVDAARQCGARWDCWPLSRKTLREDVEQSILADGSSVRVVEDIYKRLAA